MKKNYYYLQLSISLFLTFFCVQSFASDEDPTVYNCKLSVNIDYPERAKLHDVFSGNIFLEDVTNKETSERTYLNLSSPRAHFEYEARVVFTSDRYSLGYYGNLYLIKRNEESFNYVAHAKVSQYDMEPKHLEYFDNGTLYSLDCNYR